MIFGEPLKKNGWLREAFKKKKKLLILGNTSKNPSKLSLKGSLKIIKKKMIDLKKNPSKLLIKGSLWKKNLQNHWLREAFKNSKLLIKLQTNMQLWTVMLSNVQ